MGEFAGGPIKPSQVILRVIAVQKRRNVLGINGTTLLLML